MFIPNLFPSLALDSSTGEKTDAQQFNIRREFSEACNLRLLGLRSSTSLTMRSGLLPVRCWFLLMAKALEPAGRLDFWAQEG